MRILDLATRSLGGVPDGTYRFHGGDPQEGSLTVVTGPTGAGKSRLLDAVATAKQLVAGNGAGGPVTRLAQATKAGARLMARWQLNEVEMRCAETDQAIWSTALDLERDAPTPLLPSGVRRVFAMQPCRTVAGIGGMEWFDDAWSVAGRCDATLDEDEELSLRLRRSDRKYTGLAPWLASTVVAQGLMTLEVLAVSGSIARDDWPDALGAVRERLRALLPDLQLVSSELGARTPRVVFKQRDGASLALDELSRGEQRRVLFALAWERFKLDDSIVLIDDVDANAGHDGGIGLVHALRAQSPRAQIIATCSVRSVGDAARAGTVIALDAAGSWSERA